MPRQDLVIDTWRPPLLDRIGRRPRNRHIAEQDHLHRIGCRAAHAAGPPQGLQQLVLADGVAHRLGDPIWMTVSLDRRYCAIPPDELSNGAWIPVDNPLLYFSSSQNAGDLLDISRRRHRAPNHNESGNAAVLVPASVPRALAGRCAPTSTTGWATPRVRFRKNAVSSNVAVPCGTTKPARPGRRARGGGSASAIQATRRGRSQSSRPGGT